MRQVEEFRQTSSIVRRLKLILGLVAVLLLAEGAATFLSGRQHMRELQRLNELNRLTGMATKGASNLVYAREGVEKALHAPATAEKETEVFRAGLRQAEDALRAGVEASRDYARIHDYFGDAFESFQRAQEAMERISSGIPASSAAAREELDKELFVLRQFELEVIDALRKARLEMNAMSDTLFANVYAKRFVPIAVSSSFALLCFLAAAFVGLSVIRRLKGSIQALLDVTDRVAAGDLYVTVPVQAQDEVGRLSFAFDRMIANLRQTRQDVESSAQRIAHLQKITAQFSRALEPSEVADTVVSEGISVLGASGGAVLTVTSDGRYLEFFRSSGIEEGTFGAWQRFELTGSSLLATAIRELRPSFLETRAQVFESFDSAADFSAYPVGALIAVPLAVQGKLVGVLCFRFPEERGFDQRERDFAAALGALASQAYYRASLYEEAQKAIEIRDSFLSIAAHELKTPLTSLKLQVQLGELQVERSATAPLPAEKLKRVFQVCHSQADRLNSLVDDLLDVGRIESGTIVYNFTEVDMRKLIESVLERFGEALRLKDVSLELPEQAPVIVICDTFRIEQVLINLLSNSVKYGLGKPVVVRLERVNGKARISVRDHGMGIAAEKLDLIFNRFERAISARNISGLGLGLYISRRIIEAHRGKIWVESELGQGSTFVVELTAKKG